MKFNSILIITGGFVDLEFARQLVNSKLFDKVIAVDSGLIAVDKLGICPDYIVGDFDSVTKELLKSYRERENVTIKEYDPVKDATDTHIALDLARELNPKEITILGGTGNRIDHMLANISLLYMFIHTNIKVSLLDANNKIYLMDKDTVINKKELHGPFISLQPFTELVEKVTLIGFKYPLLDRDMVLGDSLGISNEVIENEAKITLQSGILLVIEAKD